MKGELVINDKDLIGDRHRQGRFCVKHPNGTPGAIMSPEWNATTGDFDIGERNLSDPNQPGPHESGVIDGERFVWDDVGGRTCGKPYYKKK